jgi:hypothetical protein
MAHISPCECSSDSNVFEPMILFVHCWYIVRAARQKEGHSWNSRTPNPSNLGDPGAWHTAQPAGISWNAKRSKSRSRSPPKTDTNIIKPEVCCWHLLTHPKKSQDTTVGDQGMILGMKPNHTQHISQRVSRANVLIKGDTTSFFWWRPCLSQPGYLHPPVLTTGFVWNYGFTNGWSLITLPKKRAMRGYTRIYRDIPHFWTAI